MPKVQKGILAGKPRLGEPRKTPASAAAVSRFSSRDCLILFVCLIPVVALGGGIGLFVLDATQGYRGVESLLGSRLGMEIQIGRIEQAGWSGMGLGVQGLELAQRGVAEAFFKAEKTTLEPDFLSLLGGRLAVKAGVSDGFFLFPLEEGPSPPRIEIKDIEAALEKTFLGGTVRGRGEGRILNPSDPDLGLRFDARGGQIRWEATFEGTVLEAKGEVLANQKPARFWAFVKAEGLTLQDVGSILKLPRRQRRIVTGTAFGSLEIQGTGHTKSQIHRTLSGRGELEVREGSLLDFNLVTALLTRITVVPGISAVLEGVVPDPFREVFMDSTTAFEALTGVWQMEGGRVRVDDLILRSAFYAIEGEGEFDAEGAFNFKARLILLEELSQFLIGRINELRVFANPEGRIAIPFLYRGKWPEARPHPDAAFIAQKLIEQEGVKLLGKGLEILEELRRGG